MSAQTTTTTAVETIAGESGTSAVAGATGTTGTTSTATTDTATAAKTAGAKKLLFKRTPVLTDVITNYCPGCTHGIVQRLVAETIDELGVEGRTVGVAPVGCSVTAYDFYRNDMVQAAHGRAPAVATGLKRALPNSVVFTYQGDGDLASIGMAETVHAATRGEKITVILINNAIYGMTGGQMSPTSLPGQVTQTSPYGRDVQTAGYPIRVCELLSTLDGVALVQRVTADSPKSVRQAKKAIKRAFEYQIEGLGFSIIEVVSTCPTNWGMTPMASFDWLRENMLPYYPLGVYKDIKAENTKVMGAGSGGSAAATGTATDTTAAKAGAAK
jgi:2-oxoglutarate ferredoxin oxidoreductase subunit beta